MSLLLFRCIECIWYKQEYDYFLQFCGDCVQTFKILFDVHINGVNYKKSLLKNFWKLRQQNWLKIRQWTLSFHFTKFVYDLLYIGIFNKKIVRTKKTTSPQSLLVWWFIRHCLKSTALHLLWNWYHLSLFSCRKERLTQEIMGRYFKFRNKLTSDVVSNTW